MTILETHELTRDADGRAHCSCGREDPPVHGILAGTNEPLDPNRRRLIDDSEAMARIGALLGTTTDWNADTLTGIADLVACTGRLHPGDEANLAAWHAFADEYGTEALW
jgi:hypothetical protein